MLNTGLVLFLIGAASARSQVRGADLEAALGRAIYNTHYEQPAASQLARARELFRHTLLGDMTMAQLRSDWFRLGFELVEIPGRKETLWLLTEPEGKEAGRGWYLFRQSKSLVALQAPHARNDVDTGAIALQLFLSGRSRVLACGTITRRRADMAHLQNTFFQALTLAFVDACPTGLLVQLHGFAEKNHAGAAGSIVASAGTASPEPWLNAFVQQLSRSALLRVLAYPRDTKALGATRNAQAIALRRAGNSRFLHLELSLSLRQRLIQDEELRRDVLNSISSLMK